MQRFARILLTLFVCFCFSACVKTNYTANNTTSYNKSLANRYYNEALHLASTDNIPLAIQKMESSLAVNPDFTEAHYFLASFYMRQKKYDLAVRAAENAIKLDVTFMEAYKTAAACLYAQGKYELSIPYYLKVLNGSAPKFMTKDKIACNVPFALGLAYAKTGKNQEALVYLKKYMETPDSCGRISTNVSSAAKLISSLEEVVNKGRSSNMISHETGKGSKMMGTNDSNMKKQNSTVKKTATSIPPKSNTSLSLAIDKAISETTNTGVIY